jgi:purine nucleosidase
VTSARRVVIDTDPGIDDAMAIAAAVASPEIDLVALTTVFGNHRLEVTTANAIRVLDHLGVVDIPVVAGADRPLLREPGPPATFVHGDDGLGDIGLPGPSRAPLPDVRAAAHLVDLVRRSDGDLTVVTIGPLTNLALALRLEPDLAGGIRDVVTMGGAAFVPGNVTPAAEANIWNDPEAAEIVFGSGVPVTMIGLDVTHQLLADLAWLERCGQMGTAAGDLIHRTAPTYVEFHRRTDGLDGIHCHDVATIAYLLRPDLFETRSLPVRVVTTGVAAGATIVAARREHGAHADPVWVERPPVEVAVGVDAPAVLDLVDALLART